MTTPVRQAMRAPILVLASFLLACPSTYDAAYQAEIERLEAQERVQQQAAYDEASRYAAVVYFKLGSSVIDETGYRELNWFVERVRGAPQGARVLVQGFADATGGESTNQKLSEERSAAVARYLETQGIAPGRIVMQGFAANFAADSNATASGRRNNRRVEVTLE